MCIYVHTVRVYVHRFTYNSSNYSERKASHYTRVFHKYLKTPFGTVIPRKDLLSALKDVFYESASDEQIRDILDVSG